MGKKQHSKDRAFLTSTGAPSPAKLAPGSSLCTSSISAAALSSHGEGASAPGACPRHALLPGAPLRPSPARSAEWREEWGGFKGNRAKGVPFQRLPFHCCAITFQRFEDPVATEDGTVYDVTSIVPYVMKYKKHPVTGEPLSLKELIKLNYHKNAGEEGTPGGDVGTPGACVGGAAAATLQRAWRQQW